MPPGQSPELSTLTAPELRHPPLPEAAVDLRLRLLLRQNPPGGGRQNRFPRLPPQPARAHTPSPSLNQRREEAPASASSAPRPGQNRRPVPRAPGAPGRRPARDLRAGLLTRLTLSASAPLHALCSRKFEHCHILDFLSGRVAINDDQAAEGGSQPAWLGRAKPAGPGRAGMFGWRREEVSQKARVMLLAPVLMINDFSNSGA